MTKHTEIKMKMLEKVQVLLFSQGRLLNKVKNVKTRTQFVSDIRRILNKLHLHPLEDFQS